MAIAVEELLEATKSGFGVADPDFDAVDDELDSIQSELMKKGSVAYYEIDWSNVFSLSVKAMNAGVHIDALTGGALAIIQSGTDHDIAQILPVLQESMDQNWDKIQPNTPKFDRLKKSRLQDVVNAIPKRFQKEPVFAEGFQEGLGNLLPAVKSVGLEYDTLEQIYTPASAEQETSSAAPNQAQPNAAAPASSTPAANPYQADLDAKGRAQLKRDIASLAARVEAYRVADPTPYYLRAFAATLDLKTAPEADENGVTAMNAMPGEIADPFEQGLSAPTQQLLNQLEQRLLNSPDWFEGQAMAVQIAESLGQVEVANAIRNRVQDRLLRLPELAELKYSNGKDYLSDKIKKQLALDGSAASPKGATNDDEQEFSDEIANTFEINGLAKALDAIEAKNKKAKSDREKAVLSILRAELLLKAGLEEFAADSLRSLEMKFENKELQNWDNKLYKRVTTILGQSD